MKGINTNLYTCIALCRILQREGDEVAVFKKGVFTQGGGGGGGEFLPPPLNTPLHMVSSNHTLKSK